MLAHTRFGWCREVGDRATYTGSHSGLLGGRSRQPDVSASPMSGPACLHKSACTLCKAAASLSLLFMSMPTPACIETCRLLCRTGSKSAPWTGWSNSYVRSSGQAHASSRLRLQLHDYETAGCRCTVLCARSLAQHNEHGLLPLACSTASIGSSRLQGAAPFVTAPPYSLCLLDHVWAYMPQAFRSCGVLRRGTHRPADQL